MAKIYIDLSKTIGSGYASGLNRYNLRLSEELAKKMGGDLVPVRWSRLTRSLREIESGHAIEPTSEDAYLIGEAFDPNKRWGWQASLKAWPGKRFAVFHDNIPGTHPELCFPHVVKRHVDYLDALAEFDSILAVSAHSAAAVQIALGKRCPQTAVVGAGADFDQLAAWDPVCREQRLVAIDKTIEALMVGIIEPRKNQEAAMEAQRMLKDKGIELRLKFIGRENDHFGAAIIEKMKAQQAEGFSIELLGAASDEALNDAFGETDILLFPSIAEGFGLPPFESLARGVPCLTWKLPGVSEYLSDAPIRWIEKPTAEEIAQGIERFVIDLDFRKSFVKKVQATKFPTWSSVADKVIENTISM